MWALLSIIAFGGMGAFFRSGKNAVWGGATIGLFAGFIIALFKGFHLIIFWKSIVLCAAIGVGAEFLGMFADYRKSKQ